MEILLWARFFSLSGQRFSFKGTSAENDFGPRIKPYRFHIMVWGFKSCNYNNKQ